MATYIQTRVPLTNGQGSIPAIGCGTWTVYGEQGTPEQVVAAIKAAIDIGFRHFDCAWNYGTEVCVGEAIKDKIDSGVVKREDLFLTTKLWNTHHNPTMVKTALQDSLKKLQTDYVDMYLMHYPTALQDGNLDLDLDSIVPRDKDGGVIFETRHKVEDVWKAMEGCYEAGLAKNIGISNFNSKQLQRILDSCKVKPSNMQIEISPYHTNNELREFCIARGVAVSAYAPFGFPARPWKEEGDPNVFEDPLLLEIATARGKTVAQVILRWCVQTGTCAIPKSVTPARLQENIDIFDFELSTEEMAKIASLNRNLRVYKEPTVIGHPEYPFDEPF